MLVKPHMVASGKCEAVQQMVEAAGLRIEAVIHIQLTREKAEELYTGHRRCDYFPWLVGQISSGPIAAILIEGDDAPRRARELAGPTKPEVARDDAPDSIRARLTDPKETFALSREQQRAVDNCVHTPDPDEDGAVKREGHIFFPDQF